MKRFVVLAILICASVPVFATTYNVGPGQPLDSISDVPWHTLGAGDIVRIHYRATPYKEKWVICRQGTAANPIVVQGVPGPNGELPIIDGNGATTPDPLNFWNEERGVIKIGGANTPSDTMPQYIVIENLEIRSARPPFNFSDENGSNSAYIANAASIYVEKVKHLTIRNCILHDSGNGLFIGSFNGQTEDVLVDGNYIYNNGNVGSFHEHNNYSAARGIVFQFNRFGPLRSGCEGNNLKDRSAGTVIRYNWIDGGNRALDLVDGADVSQFAEYSKTYVYGNVLLELNDGLNSQVVHYGGDGADTSKYRKGTLYFYNNTIVSYRVGNTTLLRLSTNDETTDVRNNIAYVTDSGSRLALMAGTGVVNYRNNWLKTGYVNSHSPVTGTINNQGGNITGSVPGFANFASQDFHLASGSACIDAGTTLASTAPNVSFQYVKHQESESRPVSAPLDMGGFEFSNGVTITVNPSSLPAGTQGVAYNQTITATGGTAPYTFSVTSGLPSGLSLASNGALTGTPDTQGSSNFTITATDANSNTGSRSYTIQINGSGSCTFCDEFNNGVLASNWTYVKGTWNETGGELVGSHATRKAEAIADPIFPGCTACTIQTTVRIGSELEVRVSILVWYQNNKNYSEVILLPAKDKIQFKQRSNGTVVAKSNAVFVLNPNTPYQLQVSFDGTNFTVTANGNLLMTIPSAGFANGTVGFRVKKGTGRYDRIEVD